MESMPSQTLEKTPEEARCDLFDCVCCWRISCSPRIPRVAPGSEYVCLPSDADDRPAWSVLVGFLSHSRFRHSESESALGLHRLGVARSGRVLGRSGGALDVVHSAGTKGGRISTASAALAPDGRSLCLFSETVDYGTGQFQSTPVAQRLQLLTGDGITTVSALPRLPLEPSMLCRPVSVAGRLWAPSVRHERPGSCSLAMHRLDEDAGRWEQVGATFPLPHKSEMPARFGGDFFQGYAVLHDKTILVSLLPSYGLFATFDCSDGGTWNEVVAEDKMYMYVPILGRGVHIKDEEDDDGAVYFLRDNHIYAYKLLFGTDGQLRLQPATIVDSVCPFNKDGYGFLTHLGDRLMCSVWIRISPGHRCHADGCGHPHVLITTFRLRPKGAAIQGIDVLHSTFRRLDVSTDRERTYQFCFLQDYEDQKQPSKMLDCCRPHLLDDPIDSDVIQPSKMLDCCRSFLSEKFMRCYGLEETTAVQVNRELYIICQAGSQSIVYVAKIENGRLKCHDQLLQQRYSLTASDDCPPWHLVFSSSSSNIYAVSTVQDQIHVSNLIEVSPKLLDRRTWPTSDPISMVLNVGDKIIALNDTLDVFCCTNGSMWARYRSRTDTSLDLNGGMKANLSGYVVLGDDSFIVSDADTMSFLLFDLPSEKWSVLKIIEDGSGDLLNGRSAFVDGFIYTCTDGGLLAYELVQQGDNKVLQDPIFLQFSWQLAWDPEKMCLDCVDKESITDAVIFCVVQGEYANHGPRSHDVHITTVQVKTTRTHGRNRRPERIDHVDIATCFVEHDTALVSTKSCFAVGT